jgi:hypothetical protein
MGDIKNSEPVEAFNGRGEYVGANGQNMNAAENFFGTFKRGMVGVYHKCDEQHLQRYVTEFEFRFNNRSGLGVTDFGRNRSRTRCS